MTADPAEEFTWRNPGIDAETVVVPDASGRNATPPALVSVGDWNPWIGI